MLASVGSGVEFAEGGCRSRYVIRVEGVGSTIDAAQAAESPPLSQAGGSPADALATCAGTIGVATEATAAVSPTLDEIAIVLNGAANGSAHNDSTIKWRVQR